MKRGLLPLIILQAFFLSCSTTRPVINNQVALKNYQAPFKVFGVGYGEPGYNILTLTDANNKYIVIKARQTASFRIGDTYIP